MKKIVHIFIMRLYGKKKNKKISLMKATSIMKKFKDKSVAQVIHANRRNKIK